jgi:cyanophycin synthetase
MVTHYRDGVRAEIARVEAIPITFGGVAPFMVENAMAATGAALGLGFSVQEIVAGLTSFRSDSSSNKGRLNVFDVAGCTAIIDYAHNDVGLRGLATFSRNFVAAGRALHLVIGTAGDRRDEDFRALGAIGRHAADRIYLKDTPAYLRGRVRGEMVELMRAGFNEGDGDGVLAGTFEDEQTAFVAALEAIAPGDVIAVMCQVDQDHMIEAILLRGGRERTHIG